MGFEYGVTAIGKLTRLMLGYAGEGGTRKIRIDMREWLEQFPGAMIVIQMVRPQDRYKYFVSYTKEKGILTWTVGHGEVKYAGKGLAQITLYNPGTMQEYKSRVVETIVARSLEEFNSILLEEDDPAQKWVNQVLEAAKRAEDAVSQRLPYIGSNGNWWIWDMETGAYADSGIAATPSATMQPLIFTGAVEGMYDGSKTVYVNIPTGGSGTDTPSDPTSSVPDYWKDHMDAGIVDANAAMTTAAMDRSAFLFYTDAHWTGSYKMAPTLLKYIEDRTDIKKTFFGGDIIENETDRSYLVDWRTQVSRLTSHHSTAGNHDDSIDNDAWTIEDTYDFLLAPEKTSEVVTGADLYYHIDSTAEKTRYIFVDTATRAWILDSTAQQTWFKNTLKATPDGWHIVIIGHLWWDYKHNDDESYEAKDTYSGNAGKVFDQIDAYNARTGEYASCTGRVEFCIGGHLHWDADYTSPGGVPVILVMCESYYSLRNGATATQGTITESSVNAIVADYAAGVVHVIRFGRGNSRTVYLDGSGGVEKDPEQEEETVEPPPVYGPDNMLGIATEDDGVTPFNNGWGFKDDTRYSQSKAQDEAAPGWDITGYIPAVQGDTFHFKNMLFMDGSVASVDANRTYVYCYDADREFKVVGGPYFPESNLPSTAWSPVYNEDGDIVSLTIPLDSYYNGTAYVRFGANDITRDTVITKNAEPKENDYEYTAPTGDFTNVLDTATDESGNVFNDGNGYINNYRPVANGADILSGGWDSTGFIAAVQGDVIRFTNMEFLDTGNAGGTYKRSAFFCYDANKQYIGQSPVFVYGQAPGSLWNAQYNSNGDIVQLTIPNNSYYRSTAFVRIVAKNIRGDSIITVNEEINL